MDVWLDSCVRANSSALAGLMIGPDPTSSSQGKNDALRLSSSKSQIGGIDITKQTLIQVHVGALVAN